ncbi:hypothetical protein Syun_018703 [Stephania yunnanensis]|uniref:Uncharacterized protein n=1 Tax=Stephania yunnanensis TaxID=152371 RepID=A0AAP0ISS6_9MAGN
MKLCLGKSRVDFDLGKVDLSLNNENPPMLGNRIERASIEYLSLVCIFLITITTNRFCLRLRKCVYTLISLRWKDIDLFQRRKRLIGIGAPCSMD